jgi:(p)ppGpp synthase/HD superfamily hydrolase
MPTLAEYINKAEVFARIAHKGQTRKYDGEPYVNHVARVATRVADHTRDPDVVQAAFLHDVIEDCEVTADELRLFFKDRVVGLVLYVTDCEKGNRKTRKELAARRLGEAPYEAQLIKVFDLIDNSHSIAKHDPKFAKTYFAEKRRALTLMTKIHGTAMYDEAMKLVNGGHLL